jgi:hypothetical protein
VTPDAVIPQQPLHRLENPLPSSPVLTSAIRPDLAGQSAGTDSAFHVRLRWAPHPPPSIDSGLWTDFFALLCSFSIQHLIFGFLIFIFSLTELLFSKLLSLTTNVIYVHNRNVENVTKHNEES